MTTCAECLHEVSKMRLADIRPGTAVAEHCASCPDCASIVQETMYAERRLTGALAEARSNYTPEDLSNRVLLESERVRRKEVGRWIRGLLLAAGCITFWFFMQDVFVPLVGEPEQIRTETVALRCLSPEQAIEIATPYLRSSGSVSSAKGLPIVTIRGKHDEFEAAISRVRSIDDAHTLPCRVPDAAYSNPSPATPNPAPTSAGKPGKD